MKSKSGKTISVGDLLSVEKDGATVEGILVEGKENNGILLPKDKIGQSAKDAGIEVELAACSHVEKK